MGSWMPDLAERIEQLNSWGFTGEELWGAGGSLKGTYKGSLKGIYRVWGSGFRGEQGSLGLGEFGFWVYSLYRYCSTKVYTIWAHEPFEP